MGMNIMVGNDGTAFGIRIINYRRSTDHLDEWVFTIELHGRVDQQNSTEFSGLVNALIDGGAKLLIVDMMELTYIDSTGLGIVINATKKLRGKEGRVAIVNKNPSVQQIFDLVNLGSFIPIFRSFNEAVNTIRV